MGSIFLIGFMASGKTTVGRQLAAAEGLAFIDLDERIEARAGRSIPEIFSGQGEPAFRALESEVLSSVINELDQAPAIVATGGGAPAHGDNLARMRRAGLVVELSAPMETMLERARSQGGAAARPLLAAGDEAAHALLAARQSTYRRAHSVLDSAPAPTVISTRLKALDLVADTLGDHLEHASICALEKAPVPILLGAGLLDSLGELTARFLPGVTRLGLVTDDNVAPLYLERAVGSLESAGLDVSAITVPAGEASKTPERHAALAESLVERGLDRGSAIIALGGGVVGDLAGYVASSLFRGIPVVQVPTTLLAMTDSAIGGKTGVNLEAGKNLLGAFWQPSFVLVDPAVLSTLPPREFRAGVGELYKYGLLDGEELYQMIDALVAAPTDVELTREVIARCAGFKSWIVARDEREMTGERALLNLGHTIGHAIERAAGYGQVLHGEAVALGLIAAARVSAALGLCGAALEEQIAASIEAAGLDAELDPWMRDDVLQHVGVDKKRTGSLIRFIALRDVGVVEIAKVTVNQIAKILVPPSAL